MPQRQMPNAKAEKTKSHFAVSLICCWPGFEVGTRVLGHFNGKAWRYGTVIAANPSRRGDRYVIVMHKSTSGL